MFYEVESSKSEKSIISTINIVLKLLNKKYDKAAATTTSTKFVIMIGLNDYDTEQQSTSELPEKPLKEWRRKFEAGNLVSSNLMQYFQTASPFFITIDQTAEHTDLGK